MRQVELIHFSWGVVFTRNRHRTFQERVSGRAAMPSIK